MNVIIVGAGPAGSALAVALARSGRRVTLVDRGPPGRSKCCGCCLSARAIPILEEAGLLETVRACATGELTQWRLWSRRPIMEESFGRHSGLVVPRDVLDAALLEEARRAGAEVLQPASAQLGDGGGGASGGANGTGVRVRDAAGAREIRAELVVGADGVGSGVARQAGFAGGRASAGRKFGFACWTRETELDPDLLSVRPGSIEMHLAECGYLGLVRSGRGIHMAALIDRNRVDRASPVEMLRGFGRTSPALAPLAEIGAESIEPGTAHESLEDAITASGPLPWRPAAVADERVALVGDAAGYVEPFTGEGMTWAFESATLLARTITAESHWSRRAADRYAAAHAAAFSRRHRRCRQVSALIERRRTFALCAQIGSRVPGLAAWLVRRVVAA